MTSSLTFDDLVVGQMYVYRCKFAHKLMDTNNSNTCSVLQKIVDGDTFMVLGKGFSGDNENYMNVLEILTATRKGWYFIYSANYLQHIYKFDGS